MPVLSGLTFLSPVQTTPLKFTDRPLPDVDYLTVHVETPILPEGDEVAT